LAVPRDSRRGLGRERNCSRSGERLTQHRQHAQVGVERDPFQSAHSQRRKAVVVLQASEGALHGGAATVKLTPTLRLSRDERMQAASLAPDGLRAALTGGTAPLRQLALEVGSGVLPAPVLAGRSFVLATLDGRRLAKRDDRTRSGPLNGLVHRANVVALVERDRRGSELALANAGEEIVGQTRLVAASRGHFPRYRQVCSSAHGGVKLEAVEASALAGRDGRAVAPRSVRVGKALALPSALRDVALAVGKRRNVGSVDGHVRSVLGKLGTERGRDAVEREVQERLVLSELAGESIERVHGGRVSKRVSESAMFRDQRGRPAPRRDRVQALDEAGSDERADRVALTSRPAEGFQLFDQGNDCLLYTSDAADE